MQDDFDNNPYDDGQNAEAADSGDLFNPEWKPRSPFRFLRFLLPPLVGGVLGFVLAAAVYFIPFYIVGIFGGIFLGVICAVLTRSAFESIDVESKPLIMSFGFLTGAFAAYFFFGGMVWLCVNATAREFGGQPQPEQSEVLAKENPAVNETETAGETGEVDESETVEAVSENVSDEMTEEEALLAMREAFRKLPAEQRYLIEFGARVQSGRGISLQSSLLRPAWGFYITKAHVCDNDTQAYWIFALIVGGIVILAAGLVAKDPMPNPQAAVHATGPMNKINPDVKP